MIIGLSGQAGCGKDTCADFLVEHHGFVKIALADPIKRATMEWWGFTEEQLWGSSEMRNKPDERYPVGWWLGCGCLINAWHQKSEHQFWVERVIETCGKPEHEDPMWVRGRLILLGLEDEGARPSRAFLTPRRALQQIGTEVARAIDPDVWLRITMRTAIKILHGKPVTRNCAVPLGHEGPIPTYEDRAYPCYDRTRGLYNYDVRAPAYVPKGVVISDCRFKNEFEGIRDPSRILWGIDENDELIGQRVSAGSLVRIYQKGAGLEGSAAQHKSEAEQQEVPDIFFDAVLHNAGDLHQLKMSVDSLMDRLTGRIILFDEKQQDVPPFKRS